MSSRLALIRDWPERAHAAGYNVSALAEACGVSPRTLQRFFLKTTGRSPFVCLNELCQLGALAEMAGRNSAKEASAQTKKYAHASSFSRAFKKFHGFPPTQAPGAPPP